MIRQNTAYKFARDSLRSRRVGDAAPVFYLWTLNMRQSAQQAAVLRDICQTDTYSRGIQPAMNHTLSANPNHDFWICISKSSPHGVGQRVGPDGAHTMIPARPS